MFSGGSADTKNEIVRFEDVTLGYGRNTVLEGLDFSIESGDFLGVIGPNGSGKTTLLRAILGDLKPQRGRITVAPGLNYGYVIQRQHLDSLFPLSVEEVVEMGRYRRLNLFRVLGREDKIVVDECLDIVGIRHLRDEAFRSLSGGQKQRVLIARALTAEPDIMLLDEPTNDLDISGENRIMDLIHEIHHSKKITVIMVSHLLHIVLNHVDELLFLQMGEITVRPIGEVVETDFLSKLYGHNISVGIINGKKVIIDGGVDGNPR